MNIGIIGTGHIGKVLAQRLAAAGHGVKVANSRGPETIAADTLSTGARAVSVDDAVSGVDVVILSIPLARIPDIAPTIAAVSADTVVIDTSNYYPHRDGRIDAIEAGQVESLWVAAALGRPIAKAWNAIGSGSFATKAQPAGSPQRIAIPVAADSAHDRTVTMTLVDDTGLDAVNAGALGESWRQQPGAPCYCTDLSATEMATALASADRAQLPARRDASLEAALKYLSDSGTTNPAADFVVGLNRRLFL